MPTHGSSDRALVSVIVPCYNQSAEALRRTLDSVVAQSYRPLELLVVDDGSKIPHAGIAAHYAEATVPMQWLRVESNSGVANARNEGLLAARGDYFAFLDAGDWWMPTKLSRQMALFGQSASNIGMVYCGVTRKNRNTGKQSNRWPTIAGDLLEPLLIRQVVTGSASAVVIRREVYESVGGFATDREIPEDRDYWLRIAQAGWQTGYINELLAGIDIESLSRSSDPVEKSKSYAVFLDKYSDLLTARGLNSAAWLHYHLAIARKHLAKREIIRGLTRAAGGIARYPGGILKLARVSVSGIWRRIAPGSRPK
ncbi:MAG: glycosyltransferase family 2 protein [Gammaproteobacteria bacterium]|nr:glycosyltransferase family 2 protein [Gammaproteobacteria bacterium]